MKNIGKIIGAAVTLVLKGFVFGCGFMTAIWLVVLAV